MASDESAVTLFVRFVGYMKEEQVEAMPQSNTRTLATVSLLCEYGRARCFVVHCMHFALMSCVGTCFMSAPGPED